MAKGKVTADAAAAGEGSGTDTRGPDGEDGFVVIDDDFVEPGDDELNQPTLPGGDTAAAQETSPFSHAAFPALGACLAAGVHSSPAASDQRSRTNPSSSSSASEAANETPPRFDAAAAAVIAAGDLVYKFLYAYAVMGYRFLQAHSAVAFDFFYAHALVAFEFLYAYAVVVVQEALAIVEKSWSRAKPTWRRWRERGPAPVKRVMKHRLFPVAVAVALSMLLVLPARWAIPRGGGGGDGPGKLSARQWQDKYDILNSKYSADLVRQRLKYDSLAGRHLELQSEYESLLKDFKNQQRAARANRNAPKAPPETCNDAESVLGPVKEALKTAEQSAYEYFSHFSEGLRHDVHEIAERCLGKTGEEGGGGGGDDGGRGSGEGGGEGGGEGNRKCRQTNQPVDDERKNNGCRDGGGSGGGGEAGGPAAAIAHAGAPAQAGENLRHDDAELQPALEREKAEDGLHSQPQQQVSVQQQVDHTEEIATEEGRVRLARRGVKGGRYVGWALKIEEPRAHSVAELLDIVELANLKKTGSEAEEKHNAQQGQQVPDVSKAATVDRAVRTSSSPALAAREPGGELADAEIFEVSGSGDMGKKVGGNSVAFFDAKFLDSVLTLDGAASDGAKMGEDVSVTSNSEAIDGVEAGDDKRVGDDGALSHGVQGSGRGSDSGKEGKEIASVSFKDLARIKEARAFMRASKAMPVEFGDDDIKDVSKDSGAKAVIPQEAKLENVKFVDEQPQTRKPSKVKPEDAKHEALRPHEGVVTTRELSERIARLDEVTASTRAVLALAVEAGDGDLQGVPRGSGAKALKPEKVKPEDVTVVDQRPQASGSYTAVTVEAGELKGERPYDPNMSGTSKFGKDEEGNPKGSKAGGKRKCGKSKGGNPDDSEKGQKGGKWKDHSLKEEEDTPKKKKQKKSKDGKSRKKKHD